MKIDSHHHLWILPRGDYRWLTPDMAEIYRDFTADDLAPHLKAAGIDKTIVVQAADSLAEAEFLLDAAAATDWIAGVVGWIDMEGAEAIDLLGRLAGRPKFRGIRPMIQDLDDDHWILRDTLDPVFDAAIDLGMTFDALVLPRHLPPLLERLKRHPDLACVVDHAAKPSLRSGDIAQWKTDMSRLANETACLCKLSGLVTEAGAGCTADTLRPVVDHLLAVFGPDRLMFGSDWPVINLAGNYLGWVELVAAFIGHLGEDDQERIWGRTAAAFYRV